MGKNQARLLRFAIRFPVWHSYGRDRSTVDAINSLCGAGFVEINENRQFRLALEGGYRAAVDDYSNAPAADRAAADKRAADRAAADKRAADRAAADVADSFQQHYAGN